MYRATIDNINNNTVNDNNKAVSMIFTVPSALRIEEGAVQARGHRSAPNFSICSIA